MGLIREPKGVDFIIKSRPLTKKEEQRLSKFIQEQKAKRLEKISTIKKTSRRTTSARKRATAKE
jgi:hypothetical protein